MIQIDSAKIQWCKTDFSRWPQIDGGHLCKVRFVKLQGIAVAVIVLGVLGFSPFGGAMVDIALKGVATEIVPIRTGVDQV